MGLKEWLEDEYDEGVEAGKAIGVKKGRKEVLSSQVKKKLEKGHTLEEIADILEEDVSVIAEIIKELKEAK